MATTGTYTARDLITDAYRKVGIVAEDEAMTADQAATGVREMNRMLKGWQNKGVNLWAKSSQTLTLTTAASYSLNPVRPIRILSARFTRSGIETPIQEMTRDEYDRLPVKTSTGQPTSFHYDRQREAALFYVWPVLAVASGETVKITYEREFDDQTDLDTVPDVPGEWWDALLYNLADRLQDNHPGIDNPKVTARAGALLDDALAGDREGSIFFGGLS